MKNMLRFIFLCSISYIPNLSGIVETCEVYGASWETVKIQAQLFNASFTNFFALFQSKKEEDRAYIKENLATIFEKELQNTHFQPAKDISKKILPMLKEIEQELRGELTISIIFIDTDYIYFINHDCQDYLSSAYLIRQQDTIEGVYQTTNYLLIDIASGEYAEDLVKSNKKIFFKIPITANDRFILLGSNTFGEDLDKKKLLQKITTKTTAKSLLQDLKSKKITIANANQIIPDPDAFIVHFSQEKILSKKCVVNPEDLYKPVSTINKTSFGLGFALGVSAMLAREHITIQRSQSFLNWLKRLRKSLINYFQKKSIAQENLTTPPLPAPQTVKQELPGE